MTAPLIALRDVRNWCCVVERLCGLPAATTSLLRVCWPFSPAFLASSWTITKPTLAFYCFFSGFVVPLIRVIIAAFRRTISNNSRRNRSRIVHRETEDLFIIRNTKNTSLYVICCMFRFINDHTVVFFFHDLIKRNINVYKFHS